MIVARSSRPEHRVAARVAEHVAAELTSDPAQISATISADPFFPELLRGPGGLALQVLTDPAEIERFYAARVTTFEIVDTQRVTELRTDWYALHESIATVRHVGDFNGVPPTGSEHRVHSVVLFPTDVDGIVGELEWTRFDFVDVFRGSVSSTVTGADWVPHTRLDAAARHDRLVRAWWAGDADGVLAELDEDPRWATRHVHAGDRLPVRSAATDPAGVRDQVVAFAAAGTTRVERLQRVTADWFSFGEWEVTTDAGSVRVASLAPVGQDGRLRAQLAYAVDAGDED